MATEYGVGWDTAWAAVELHGSPLVEDPFRVGPVRALGVDEHSYLSATPEHATIYATGLVDLDRRIMIDLFEGKSAAKLRRWTARRSERWRIGVRVVALDLTETYRAGLSPHLSHAQRVADPFHVTRVANRMLDQVRRRVQNETLGHRGRKAAVRSRTTHHYKLQGSLHANVTCTSRDPSPRNFNSLHCLRLHGRLMNGLEINRWRAESSIQPRYCSWSPMKGPSVPVQM